MSSLQHLLLTANPSSRSRRGTPGRWCSPGMTPKQDGRRPSSTSALMICRDAGSCAVGTPAIQPNGSAASSSLGRPDAESATTIGEGAVDAIVSLLSAAAERFLEDEPFRGRIREACLEANDGDSSATSNISAAVADLKAGIETMENLMDSGSLTAARSACTHNPKHSFNDPKRLFQAAVAVPKLPSALAALGHLYLSATRRIEGAHRSAACHVLRAIRAAPRIARVDLLPGLWARLFRAPLLRLEVWRRKEIAAVEGFDEGDRRQREEELINAHEVQMDSGTARLAGCYLEWIKAGGVKQLPIHVNGCITGKDNVTTAKACSESAHDAGKDWGTAKSREALIQSDKSGEGKKIQQPAFRPLKSNSSRLFTCDGNAHRAVVQCRTVTTNPVLYSKEGNGGTPMSIDQAISVISSCSPTCNLERCDEAVQVVASAWSESKRKPDLEKAISSPEAVEWILQVISNTGDDKVMEFSISILAELVSQNKVNRRVILNADPQLEIFSPILQHDSLFLKAAILVYLLRPQAKQMLLAEWVPFSLRVLEYGDHPQALFSVIHSPRSAAIYLLGQLLRGFDADRSSENARRVVGLGGHKLLMEVVESGDLRERRSAAALLVACIRADGSCREYVAGNVRKSSVLELLEGNQLRSDGHAFSLLLEASLLRRRAQITKFLIDLKNEASLNAMHVLLVYLQQSPPERRPLVASILLQLDLLGDSSRFSIYREEAVEAIITALASKKGRKIQEQCSRALLILAGRFSSAGEPSSEEWFLKKAGFDDCFRGNLSGGEDATADHIPKPVVNAIQTPAIHPRQDEEDQGETENWLRRLAIVLLNRGNERFLTALSDCIANGIPSLVRSCLLTVAWMSSSISLPQNVEYIWHVARPSLLPQILECLSLEWNVEDRVLASASLLNIAKKSECFLEILPLDCDRKKLLEDLSQITWTAKETLLLATNDPAATVSDKPNCTVKT